MANNRLIWVSRKLEWGVSHAMLELWRLVRHDNCTSLLHREGKHIVVFSVEASWSVNVGGTNARTKSLVSGDYGVRYGAWGK